MSLHVSRCAEIVEVADQVLRRIVVVSPKPLIFSGARMGTATLFF